MEERYENRGVCLVRKPLVGSVKTCAAADMSMDHCARDHLGMLPRVDQSLQSSFHTMDQIGIFGSEFYYANCKIPSKDRRYLQAQRIQKGRAIFRQLVFDIQSTNFGSSAGYDVLCRVRSQKITARRTHVSTADRRLRFFVTCTACSEFMNFIGSVADPMPLHGNLLWCQTMIRRKEGVGYSTQAL